MNTLIQECLAPTNDFQFSESVFPEENHVLGYKVNPSFNEFSPPTDGASSPVDSSSSSSSSTFSSEGENNNFKEDDHSDAILKFIGQMLMEEEDLENKPCMLHDCLALQATEKSLLNVLNNNPDENQESPNDHFTKCDSISSGGSSGGSVCTGDFESLISTPPPQLGYTSTVGIEPKSSINKSGPKKKNRYREDGDFHEGQRSNKHLASNVGESEPLDMYDKVLLCSNSDRQMAVMNKKHQKKERSNRGRPKGGGRKQGSSTIGKEVVDLRSLLMQCAQAVGSYDSRTVTDLLARIRQHSSPRGDGTERLAHYLANALEARQSGTGTASCYGFACTRISAAEILKGYKVFITACPFRKISNVLANKTIKKLATRVTTLHIIDIGILYGFQWPCLIQALSERPGGPPRLRITGIDFPQPGFRPTERVEDTGRRLAKYCERFGVPFEFKAIAQKWETIKLEDLDIDRNNYELLVVYSLYRLQNVPDETVMENCSPRDAVLNLIKKISPDMFIHGAINGTYNTPFFVTRFREALFQFSSFFDMFDATVPREDPDRLLFEEEVIGRDAMNIIACEGTERVDRPETYKQWGARDVRAGFRQIPLDQEIVKYVRNKVKMEYHKDFSVDEDGKWMLQGWKGRVLFAISCWQPVHE